MRKKPLEGDVLMRKLKLLICIGALLVITGCDKDKTDKVSDQNILSDESTELSTENKDETPPAICS